jgi:hypothetical protein
MQAQLAIFEITVMMENAVFGRSLLKDFHAGNKLPFLIESVPKRIGAGFKSFRSFFVGIKTVNCPNVLGGNEAVIEERGSAKGLTFLIQDKLCV